MSEGSEPVTTVRLSVDYGQGWEETEATVYSDGLCLLEDGTIMRVDPRDFPTLRGQD